MSKLKTLLYFVWGLMRLFTIILYGHLSAKAIHAWVWGIYGNFHFTFTIKYMIDSGRQLRYYKLYLKITLPIELRRLYVAITLSVSTGNFKRKAVSGCSVTMFKKNKVANLHVL